MNYFLKGMVIGKTNSDPLVWALRRASEEDVDHAGKEQREPRQRKSSSQGLQKCDLNPREAASFCPIRRAPTVGPGLP